MRSRCCSAFVFLLLLSFLCACGKPSQSAALSPFSADLSFVSDGTAFEGVLTLKNSKTMQLMLRTPRELQGLCFVFENETAALRFGDAAVSLDDAQALGLPETQIRALMQALSACCDAAQILSENGTAEVPTDRGPAKVVFLPQTNLPQYAELGELTFSFKNGQALFSQ